MLIKNLIIIIIFLSINGANSQNNWIRQNTPTGLWLYKCTFPDSLTGWAAGEDGIIIKTTNGGQNWLTANSPVNFFIYDIFFLNSRLGWALANDNFANGTAVLSTTNSGNNWNYYRFPDSTVQLFSVHYTDSLHGFMGGYGGKIFRTVNGGVNWIEAGIDSSLGYRFPINRISFNNSFNNFGLAVGGAFDILGVIWITSNGGINWQAKEYGNEPFHCFQILSPSKVIVLGGDYDFGVVQAKTYNSGASWQYDYLNNFGIPKGLSFRTESEGWAVLSIMPQFFYTLDTGNTWNVMNVPDTSSLYDIIFTDPYHGYAVGTKGSVYKYNTAAIGIGNNQHNMPQSNSLFQNYPNPFNPLTIIEYSITKPSGVKIIIYDITGREVKKIFDGFREAGTYKVQFDSGGLSSGIYFYKLESELFSESKKMVILK